MVRNGHDGWQGQTRFLDSRLLEVALHESSGPSVHYCSESFCFSYKWELKCRWGLCKNTYWYYKRSEKVRQGLRFSTERAKSAKIMTHMTIRDIQICTRQLATYESEKELNFLTRRRVLRWAFLGGIAVEENSMYGGWRNPGLRASRDIKSVAQQGPKRIAQLKDDLHVLSGVRNFFAAVIAATVIRAPALMAPCRIHGVHANRHFLLPLLRCLRSLKSVPSSRCDGWAIKNGKLFFYFSRYSGVVWKTVHWSLRDAIWPAYPKILQQL